MKIIRLEAENIKRLRAVSVSPSGAAVRIAGRNAQGKSSLLDSIEMALGGGKSIPTDPVRHGERRGRVLVDLGDLVIERTFDSKGTRLIVRNAEGVEQKSPQGILDALCSRVAFDPFAFSKMDPPKQDETLRKAIGLDWSELDAHRKKAFDDRADVNREAKALEARIQAMPRHAEALPAVSVADLLAELQKREQAAAVVAKAEGVVRDRAAKEGAKYDEIEAVSAEIRRLQERRTVLEAEAHELAKATEEAREALAILGTPSPVDEVREQLATAEERNRKARENEERASAEASLGALRKRSEALTDQIAAIDEEKRVSLEAASFPVPGLGFDETGPTLNGIPLAQASQAERLRVSIAIGLALNPKLRVLLVREGALLDEEAMGILETMATEADAQVWIERVGKGDPGAIIIEDGSVESDSEGVAAE